MGTMVLATGVAEVFLGSGPGFHHGRASWCSQAKLTSARRVGPILNLSSPRTRSLQAAGYCSDQPQWLYAAKPPPKPCIQHGADSIVPPETLNGPVPLHWRLSRIWLFRIDSTQEPLFSRRNLLRGNKSSSAAGTLSRKYQTLFDRDILNEFLPWLISPPPTRCIED